MSFFITLYATAEQFKGTLNLQLSKPLRLRGEWEVGVYSCHISEDNGIFWVLSDVVDFSYVNDVPVQLIDIVDVSDLKNSKPMYVKLIRKQISSINVEIRKKLTGDIHEGDKNITCILHFRKP